MYNSRKKNKLYIYWINIYISLLDYIIYNIRKNLITKEFIYSIDIINIVIKLVFVKVYWFVGLIEKDYYFIYRLYIIIKNKIKDKEILKK